MKNLFFASILVLIFCYAALAQTSAVLPCPKISLESNTTTPNEENFIVYTVSMSSEANQYNIRYNWTVRFGSIVSGNETSSVKVKVDENSLYINVQITGLPAQCSNTASESFVIDPPYPIQFDEFSISTTRINKASLNSLAAELQNNPGANVYIFENFRSNVSQKLIKQKIQKTIAYLSETNGINKDRITILYKRKRENLTKIFIVLVGATPPHFDDN